MFRNFAWFLVPDDMFQRLADVQIPTKIKPIKGLVSLFSGSGRPQKLTDFLPHVPLYLDRNERHGYPIDKPQQVLLWMVKRNPIPAPPDG